MPYHGCPFPFAVARGADIGAGIGVEGATVWRHHHAMKPLALPSLVLALALSMPAAFAPAPALAQAAPQATLPIVNLKAGIHVIRAELADTPKSRQIGLMHRE